MKAWRLALAALLLSGVSAFAQEDDDPLFFRHFTLEVSAGLPPIHTLIATSYLRSDADLADEGIKADLNDYWCPAFSVSAAWHTSLRWEWVLTGGCSWINHGVTRYGTFGIDPQGKPRYDLNDPHPAGRKDSYGTVAIFAQGRRFWNPTQKVKLYSAFGLGIVTDGDGLAPLPSLTPIAVRFGTGPLKFFIENTFSPAATLVNLGLGWTF